MGRPSVVRTAVIAVVAWLAIPASSTTSAATMFSVPEVAQLANAGSAIGIHYPTSDAAGRPTFATAAVYVPPGSPPAGGWPVIAYAHGTVGLGDDCSQFRLPRTADDVDYLNFWIAQGYAVVAPDYVGIGGPGVHPYLHGRSEATAIADSVAAAVRAIPKLSSEWMVVGQSQGGNAALHTLAAQSRQPTLDFRGAVTTGAVVAIEQLFPASDGRTPRRDRGITPLELYLLTGLKVVRPDIEVDDYLTDEGRRLVREASELCYLDLERETRGRRISQLLARDPSPLRKAIADYADVPPGGYRQPVFIAHGTRDNVVGASRADAFVRHLVARGEPVRYRTYPTDHWATMRASVVDTEPFVRSQFSR